MNILFNITENRLELNLLHFIWEIYMERKSGNFTIKIVILESNFNLLSTHSVLQNMLKTGGVNVTYPRVFHPLFSLG